MQASLPPVTYPASTHRELQILHLEDSEFDHELMLAHLARGGLRARMQRVDSEAEFLTALGRDWDAIISDYNLPGFSGLVALDLLKASGRDVPFILVSGEIGEDTAVEAMRNGANDYLLKNNLARLVPALLHAVEAMETRRARVSAARSRARSTTTWAARSPRSSSTWPGSPVTPIRTRCSRA
jgi:DNA-binding NtrC family response regulator